MKAKYECLTTNGKSIFVLASTDDTVNAIIEKARIQSGFPISDVINEFRIPSANPNDENDDDDDLSIDDDPIRNHALSLLKTIKPTTRQRSFHKKKNKIKNEDEIKIKNREGRTSAEVNDTIEVNNIKLDHTKNGGQLSYNAIESKYGLRSANGMNAYRIVNR